MFWKKHFWATFRVDSKLPSLVLFLTHTHMLDDLGTESLQSSSDTCRQLLEEEARWPQTPCRAAQTHSDSPWKKRRHGHRVRTEQLRRMVEAQANTRRSGHRFLTEQPRRTATDHGRGGDMGTDSLRSSSAHMSVATPQRNACICPESVKSTVFLKVAFTKHKFLHVVEMLELQQRSLRSKKNNPC